MLHSSSLHLALLRFPRAALSTGAGLCLVWAVTMEEVSKAKHHAYGLSISLLKKMLEFDQSTTKKHTHQFLPSLTHARPPRPPARDARTKWWFGILIHGR